MNKLVLSILLIIVAMVMASENTFAQTVFYSPKVDSLYRVVNQNCSMDSICINDTILQCADLVKGDTLSVILCKDENGVVDHIGYCFLPDSIRSVNIPIIRFIERELLTILTAKDICTALRVDTENGLRLFLDSIQITPTLFHDKKRLCSLLKECRGVIINRISKGYDVSILCANGRSLTFLFPADCKLISGMDKREQENKLAYQLKKHRTKTLDGLMPSPDVDYLQLLQDTTNEECFYIKKGSEFNIPQINNDLFYLEEDTVYSLVSDTSKVAWSFSNAMLVPTDIHYIIHVKHRMYGFVVQEYSIDSRDFNDYFSHGYERYFGIETLDTKNLSGTMILYNSAEEYIHLAYVTTTLDDLIHGGRITMELYSNIPQHNIKTLLGNKNYEYE